MPIDPQEDGLTVTLEESGKTYSSGRGIEEYRISSSWLTPTDAWSFTVYDDENPAQLRTTFRPWQPIKLAINGQVQILGRIDKIESAGESGAALTVSGRDYLADAVDATVDPAIQIKKEMDLGAAMLEIFRPFGIVTILGEYNLTRNILTGVSALKGKPRKNFKAANPDELRPGENVGVMEWANRIVARHGFMIQPADNRGTIGVFEPHDLQEPQYELARPGNILAARASRDYTDVPTVTIARGRAGNPSAEVKGTLHEYATFGSETLNPITKIPEIRQIIFPENGVGSLIREQRFDLKKPDPTLYAFSPPVYKPLFYADKDSKNQEQLEYGAKRMVADRLKKTLDYTCTVRGHVDARSGALWAINTVAHVLDQLEQLSERLWLYERDFFNEGKGPMTALKFMRQDSFYLG
jgi:prophage tail gpP-like protein